MFNIEIIKMDGRMFQNIYYKDTYDEALKAHHEIMGYHIRLQGCTKVTAAILTIDGNILQSDTWNAPVSNNDAATPE